MYMHLQYHYNHYLLCRLSVCEKALAEYLETKRLAFPRFYFVSSADLLDILSKGNQPSLVILLHHYYHLTYMYMYIYMYINYACTMYMCTCNLEFVDTKVFMDTLYTCMCTCTYGHLHVYYRC